MTTEDSSEHGKTTAKVADIVPFSDLCKVLDFVTRHRRGYASRAQVSKFISQWRQCHAKLHQQQSVGCSSSSDDSFYPAMRLILPSFDKDRGAYGFKENMLAKRFIRICGLSSRGEASMELLNYKAPSSNCVIGDFASVASKVLSSRLCKNGNLSLAQVNQHLDAIALANANKQNDIVDKELMAMLRAMNELELKWLVRILLKQMKLGMQETSILTLFHPEAIQLYDVTSCLYKVCTELHSPNTRLDVIHIQIFCPFRPMLANRLAPDKVVSAMQNRPFYVETKFDGERVQLHKNGEQYKYFSRNANDWTSSYGSTRDGGGSLTPFIHELFAQNVHKCILDGEMVGYNPLAECIVTKGDNFDVKSLRDGDDLHPCFVPFDCLQLNDNVLSMEALQIRLENLRNVFGRQTIGRLMLAQQRVVSTQKELADCLNEAIDNREEGIIIKRPDSTYRLNTRSTEAGWLKLKPDYIDGINDDFDLVIVGGYFGKGKRANLLSHFLLAVCNPPTDSTDTTDVDGMRYTTVCKVGSGYSMKELYDLNLHLNSNGLMKRANQVPQWLRCGTEKPSVYIHPKHSAILQVRAADIVKSKSYGTGYGLRFGRVVRVRGDKDVRNVRDFLSEDAFHQLRLEFQENVAKRRRLALETDTDQLQGQSPAKKRKGGRSVARAQLPESFRAPNLNDVIVGEPIFSSKEFCVLNGTNEHSKEDLERLIAGFGGKLVQNPGEETHCVVAGKKTVKMNSIIGRQMHNVVKVDWLLRCARAAKELDWTPNDMWFALDKTKADFNEKSE